MTTVLTGISGCIGMRTVVTNKGALLSPGMVPASTAATGKRVLDVSGQPYQWVPTVVRQVEKVNSKTDISTNFHERAHDFDGEIPYFRYISLEKE